MPRDTRRERRQREEKPDVRGAPLPPDLLLRAGLRFFVVALAPVRTRPHTRLHRRFRAVPGGASRARPHPWQGRHPRAVEGNGALAYGAGVVRGGALAPRGGRPRVDGGPRSAGGPAPPPPEVG